MTTAATHDSRTTAGPLAPGWADLGEQIDAIGAGNRPAVWARKIAEALRRCWPAGGPCGCRFDAGHERAYCLLTEDGENIEEDVGRGADGSVVYGEAVRERARMRLEATAPDGVTAETRALLEGLLTLSARQALACWHARQGEEQLRLEEGRGERAELAGVLIHEFNNVLNNISLQLVLLERNAPPQAREDLGEVRRQIVEVSGLVQKYHAVGKLPASPPKLHAPGVVLNNAVVAVQKCKPASGIRWRVELPADLPPARIDPADFRLLTTYLLRNAVAGVVGTAGEVLVQMSANDRSLNLRIHDSGPQVAAALLSRLFSPTQESRPGANGMELAAARAIVRRCAGRLTATTPPDGGLDILVELPIGEESRP